MKDADSVNKTIAMVILLILCILCLGMGLTGLVVYFKDTFFTTPELDTGPTVKSFFQDGNLNFYKGTDLVAEYKCESSFCGWAYEKVDDVNYSLKYYQDESIDQLSSLILDRYAFIVDGEKKEDDQYNYLLGVKLYDTQAKKVIGEYNSVKNYSSNLINNTFIVQDKNGKWGVIDIQDGKVNIDISFEYDFIGQFYRDPTESLDSISKYVVLENGSWYVIDSGGNKQSSGISEPIYGYEGDIIVAGKDSYSVYNKNGGRLFTNRDKVIFTGKNMLVFYNDKEIDLIDASNGSSVYSYTFSRIDSAKIEDSNSELRLVVNGSVIYTYKMQ